MLQQANKNGISLIILVITIIIVIILAGAVIVSLNNSGVIAKAKLAKESSEFTNIREAVELEKQNMLLTGTFDKNKIDIPNKYEDDIEVTGTGEILIKYNQVTKIIDIANAIKILGASYISNGFDEIQSISGGTASAGETKLAKIIIEGKSEQAVTTQGKNLFDFARSTWGVLGTGTVTKTTGYVEHSSSSSNGYGINSNTINVEANTDYTIKAVGTIVSGTANFLACRIHYMDTDTYSEVGNPYVFNTGSNTHIQVCLYVGMPNDDACVARWSNIQLEQGSTATTYASFVPNSPSPDYPSTINSVNNFNVVTSGTNLWNLPQTYITDTANNTFTNGGFGYYQIYTSMNQSYTLVTDETRYTNDSVASPRIGVVVRYSDGTDDYFYGNTWNIPTDGVTRKYIINVTPNANKKISHLRGWLFDGGAITYRHAKAEKIMLLAGNYTTNTIPEYQVYQGKTINFPNTTLRSLPDGTKDYIEIDNVAKTAKLYKNIEEKIFDGSEYISFDFNAYMSYAIAGSLDVISQVACLSTHYKTFSWGTLYTHAVANDGLYGVAKSAGCIRFYVPFLTKEDFKAFLVAQYNAGTPVTVQYKLATPIVTDLTYQELPVEYPITNIYTTSAVKPRIIGQVTNK